MEQIPYLEQFKLEILKLTYENVNELSKVAAFNTQTYNEIIGYLVNEVIAEAEAKKTEKVCLIEIRKLWVFHITFLDAVRNIYDNLKYNKLQRPKVFNDRTIPAYMELIGSVTSSNNPLIVLDERQQLYWQYLSFARILEGAMIAIEKTLSDKLGVKTNFKDIPGADPGFYSDECIIGAEFMIDLVLGENPENLKDIKEAEAFVRGVLNKVYAGAGPIYYDWIVKSILKFPFPMVKIPEVGQDEDSFVIPYDCTKDALYVKINHIKRKIYPSRKGKKHLGEIFVLSTENFNDSRVLDFQKLMDRI